MYMSVHSHIAEALTAPALVRLRENVYLARFEAIKVNSALAAVRTLLERGTVRPGDTLIDCSSGSYAYSLALACHRYGMRCHIVGSTTVDRTLKIQLEVLGATLEQVRPSTNLQLDQELQVRRVREILRERPDAYWMQQYHDDIHYLGYRDFADRVRESVPLSRLTVVGAVGSGASTGALASYLREDGFEVPLVGIQPFGSVSFGSEHIQDPQALIAGIGSAVRSDNVRYDLYDRIHWIEFDHALAGSVDLLRRHAVFAGLSSGAAYLATHWEAANAPDRDFLFIAPDTGHRYVDAVFAHYREAVDIDSLAPVRVSALRWLAMPWSTMDWKRRAYSVPEVPGTTASALGEAA